MSNHHFFATHALNWATSDVSREDAIEKLCRVTDPTWVKNCLKSGNLLTVFTCQVNCPMDQAYKIQWFQPVDVDTQDGENYYVTYLTRTTHAVMRDPSDALGLEIKRLEADGENLRNTIESCQIDLRKGVEKLLVARETIRKMSNELMEAVEA
jgi:hypothetical protein